MEIYLGLLDNDNHPMTEIIGVFSSEEKARAACEEDADEPLPWKEDRAVYRHGTYTVMLLNLDVAL